MDLTQSDVKLLAWIISELEEAVKANIQELPNSEYLRDKLEKDIKVIK